MTEKKREPPRPQIRKREDVTPPPRTGSGGGAMRHTTMEVQANWLEEDDAPRAPKPARATTKSTPPNAAVPAPATSKAVPPLKRVPRPSSPNNKAVPSPPPSKDKAVSSPSAPKAGSAPRPSRAKITIPTILYAEEPPELSAPVPQVVRPRGRLPPAIPREERDSDPPPRPRRSKPPPR